jgi:hypothetical protein
MLSIKLECHFLKSNKSDFTFLYESFLYVILHISEVEIVGNKKCLMNIVFSHSYLSWSNFFEYLEGLHIWTFAALNLSIMIYLNTLN